MHRILRKREISYLTVCSVQIVKIGGNSNNKSYYHLLPHTHALGPPPDLLDPTGATYYDTCRLRSQSRRLDSHKVSS